jgi:Fe-S-cluster containining protein
MFKNDDVIHFSCEKCGKCCEKSPLVNFYDMFNLADEFVFQTAHHGFISYTNKEIDKDLTNFYSAIGHTIVLPEFEAVLFYFIDFMTIDYPSYKQCSKLKDNLCSIYDKRPNTCKIAPLSTSFNDNVQWKSLNFYKKNVEENEWKCNFNKTEPIIYQHQQIYQPGHNSIYFQTVDINRDFTDKYVNFIKSGGEKYFKNHFKAVVNTSMSNSQMITDLVIPLKIALNHKILDTETIMSFIEKQIKTIEKEIKSASFFKRKDDLKTTRLYKRQKDDYIKAIKEKLFEVNDDNFKII